MNRRLRNSNVFALLLLLSMLTMWAHAAMLPAEASPSRQLAAGSVAGVPQFDLPTGVAPDPVRPVAHPYLADYRLTINGVRRAYRLFVPPGLVGRAPVVVAMTGWTLTGDPENYMHWRMLALARHFVVLEPRGYGASWNAGTCCGAAVRDGIDDHAALTMMLASADGAYPLNRHRLYLVGYSNGGMMAYDYACRSPGAVAAIGVVASAYMSRCAPRQAVPVMQVHGARDYVLPAAGGWSPLLQRKVPSLAQSRARYLALDSAAGTPQRTVLLPGAEHNWPRLGWVGNYDTTQQLFAYLWQFQR